MKQHTQGGQNPSTPDTVSSENATLESTAEIWTFHSSGNSKNKHLNWIQLRKTLPRCFKS